MTRVLITAATTHQRPPLPATHDEIRLVTKRGLTLIPQFPFLVRKQGLIRNECGHNGPRCFALDVYGERLDLKEQSKCPDCLIEELRQQSIRCALCGWPIFAGQRTSLTTLDIAYVHNENPWTQVLVGTQRSLRICCLRETCVDSLLSMCGKWTPEGYESVRGGLEEVLPIEEYKTRLSEEETFSGT